MAGQNIAGSPLPLLVQERVIPHTQSAPKYVDQASYYDRCWATIVTSPSFVLGAVALAHSLNPDSSSSAATKIALVTALLPAVDRSVLSAAGWLLHDVPVIPNPNSGHVEHFSNVYSKLHVFALEGTCGRVVYLDADVVAVDVRPPSRQYCERSAALPVLVNFDCAHACAAGCCGRIVRRRLGRSSSNLIQKI
jgi:hypothetical protein